MFATCCTLAVDVTVPYVAAGKRAEAAVLDPIVDANALAPVWDPSKKVVVLVTTMEPADTLSMVTSTLYELNEALIVLINCEHRECLSTVTKWTLRNHCKTATLTFALAASPKSLGVENPEKVVTACTAGTDVLLLTVLEVLEADAGGDGEASSGEGDSSPGEGDASFGDGEASSGEEETFVGDKDGVSELPVLG